MRQLGHEAAVVYRYLHMVLM